MTAADVTNVAELLDRVRARLKDEFPKASESFIARCVDTARGFTTSEPMTAQTYAAAVERFAKVELAVACATPGVDLTGSTTSTAR